VRAAIFITIIVLLGAPSIAFACACPGCPKEPGYDILMISELMVLAPEILGMSIADAVVSASGGSLQEAYSLEMNVRFSRLGLGATTDAPADQEIDIDPWPVIIDAFADTAKGSLGTATSMDDITGIYESMSKALDDVFAHWLLREYDRRLFLTRSWLLALNYALNNSSSSRAYINEGLIKHWLMLEKCPEMSEEERAGLRFMRRKLEAPPLSLIETSERAREAASSLLDDFDRWTTESVCSRLSVAIGKVEGSFDSNRPEKVARDFRDLILLMGHLEKMDNEEANEHLKGINESLESIAIVTHGGFLPDSLINRVPENLARARRFFSHEKADAPILADKGAEMTAKSKRLYFFYAIAGLGVVVVILSPLLKKNRK